MVGRRYSFAVLLIGLACLSPALDLRAQNVERTAFDHAANVIVMITVDTDDGEEFGAGIIFGFDQSHLYVASANHLFRRGSQLKASQILVQFKEIQGEYEAELQDTANPGLDLAILKIEIPLLLQAEGTFKEVRLNKKVEDLERGQGLHAIGFASPSGQGWDHNLIPHRFDRLVGSSLFFEAQSQSISEGYSGGGVFTEKYELIGMVKHGSSGQSIRVEAESFVRIEQEIEKWRYPLNVFKNDSSRKAWPWIVGGGVVATVVCLLVEDCPTKANDAIADAPGRPGIWR